MAISGLAGYLERLMSTGRFLTANWRHLAMLNYEADPLILRDRVPRGTELDSWNGRTLISVVGFLFLDTRVLGIPIPFHRDFEEVNLRFYVRRRGPDGWRRGVVFVKEIVPRWAIAAVARACYGERYAALPMRHQVELENQRIKAGSLARFDWQVDGQWSYLQVRATGQPVLPEPGSEEEFITEHYWGYASQRSGGTMEYQVEHPQWKVWQASEAKLECSIKRIYGSEFEKSLQASPSSAFIAEGSGVTVRQGLKLNSE